MLDERRQNLKIIGTAAFGFMLCYLYLMSIFAQRVTNRVAAAREGEGAGEGADCE